MRAMNCTFRALDRLHRRTGRHLRRYALHYFSKRGNAPKSHARQHRDGQASAVEHGDRDHHRRTKSVRHTSAYVQSRQISPPHAKVQPAASNDTREGAIGSCLDMLRERCHPSWPEHGSPEKAPSVLKFSQSRSARGHRVHVLQRAAGAGMSTTDRHRTAFDAQNAKYAARALDRHDDTRSPNSPPIRPGQFFRE